MIAAGGTTSIDIPDGWQSINCSSNVCTAVTPCSAGRFGVKSTDFGTACLACPAGKSSFKGTTTCNPCTKGRYSAREGLECSFCNVGRYQEQFTKPSIACLLCPTGYTQISTGESSCVAIPGIVVSTKKDCAVTGKYLNQTSAIPTEWKCEYCPRGGWCARQEGGVTQDGIEAKFGWYRLQNVTTNRPPVFRKCLYPPACLGKPNPEEFGTQFEALWSSLNATEKCNEMLGHDANSFLCADCLPSYSHSGFSSNILTCSKCPEQGSNALVLVGLGLLVSAVVLIMMCLKFRGARQVKIKAAHSTLKRIVLSHLQVIGVVMALDVPW
jgi:hypothetical protein